MRTTAGCCAAGAWPEFPTDVPSTSSSLRLLPWPSGSSNGQQEAGSCHMLMVLAPPYPLKAALGAEEGGLPCPLCPQRGQEHFCKVLSKQINSSFRQAPWWSWSPPTPTHTHQFNFKQPLLLWAGSPQLRGRQGGEGILSELPLDGAEASESAWGLFPPSGRDHPCSPSSVVQSSLRSGFAFDPQNPPGVE